MLKSGPGILLIAIIAMMVPFLSGWGPALRDTAGGNRLSDSQATALRLDHVPSTIGPVVDLVDDASGRTLYSRRATKRHAIGSITKLMTATLAMHHLKLNRVVSVSDKAGSIPGDVSRMWILPGDHVSIRALLYGLLIPSGDDAAEQLAETMAGTDSGFAAMMNAQAGRYHLRCSHYVTPDGLDAKGQYSCAADVATMSRIVLGNRFLAHIVSTKHIVIAGAQPRLRFDLVNTNLLLDWYPGAIGVKTGTTDQAGFSVTAAARRAGHGVIAVVLGSTDFGRFTDAASLLDFAFRNYVWPQTADTMWSTASLEHHAPAQSAPVPRWEESWLSVDSVGNKEYVSAPFDSH